MTQQNADALASVFAEAIDEAFYAFVYSDLPANTVAAEHYISVGWREGRDPNPWFSTKKYVAEHPEAARDGIVPLFHYLEYAGQDGIAAVPSEHAEAFHARACITAQRTVLRSEPPISDAASSVDVVPDQFVRERRLISPEFDADYYREVYTDVAAAGVDPLLHFLRQGWREGRNPNAWFSTEKYLEANGDVRAAGINPFVHYVQAGRKEGRRLKLGLGFRYDILMQQKTVTDRLSAIRPPTPEEIGLAEDLWHALTSAERSQQKRLHISVSHDNFAANLGGLQLCLQREADGFAVMNVDHLHLFPLRPRLFTDHENEDPVLGVLVNCVYVGAFSCSVIADVGTELTAQGLFHEKSLAIHSLLGHNAKALVKVLESMRIKNGYFWIHDFSSVCAGHNLLRNDVEFCGAPAPDSVACGICVYGSRRRVQVADHEYVFSRIALTVVAPAQRTLDTWKGGATVTARAELVKPHCVFTPQRSHADCTSSSGPLRVAYLALPNAHKGWPIFEELVSRFGYDERYAFYHLGKFRKPGWPVKFVDVEVRSDRPDSMVRAIEAYSIDVAVIWSLCPETFCFTAHEAIAAGAAVITTQNSGNLTQVVRDTGKGRTFSTEDELYEQFTSGDICKLARANTTVETFVLEYGRLTADLVAINDASPVL